ncbi:hypothetical protein PR048_008230 [Dryococelus australis]|uniref:Uncharacterized protein n=1 Tax=Dryococelus australis TaxID=614101 RepID=A0ABQ9HWI0_9NEOP|nr:hypothetical protein PR048_008230 [Dryococelus australis]
MKYLQRKSITSTTLAWELGKNQGTFWLQKVNIELALTSRECDCMKSADRLISPMFEKGAGAIPGAIYALYMLVLKMDGQLKSYSWTDYNTSMNIQNQTQRNLHF